MVDRSTNIPGNQIEDDTVKQTELDITNIPTNNQILQINMPTGDFTAIDLGDIGDITTMQTNIVLNAFRIAINGSLTQFNMVDGIVDEYEDENSIDNPNSTNELYDSVNDLYSPLQDVVSTSPFAHYKCNDNASNTTVTDDGTGANNGTGNVNTSNYSITGKINQAFELNGSSEFININLLQADIKTDTTGSIAFWIDPDSTGADNDCIFSLSNSTGDTDFKIQHNKAGGFINFNLTNVGSDRFSGRTPNNSVPNNTFTHIVFVQNGTIPTIYINGVEETGVTYSVTTAQGEWFNDLTSTDTARIGSLVTNSLGERRFWTGAVDDFRYYQNTILTLSDASAIHNSGTGTEDDQPASDANNMTLISTVFTAESVPSNARIVLFEEDVDAVTLNTDLKAFVTRDAGQTFTTDFATDDKLDITSHGFSNTDRIMVTSSAQDLPAGLDSATVYFVINATTNDFELSLTSGGLAVDITDNGTGTHTAKQVSEITLANDGEYETGKNILTGSINISGQPSGTSMEYQLITANNKDLNIHGTGLSWD